MTNRWLALPNDTKTKIKQDALLTMGSPQAKAGTFASRVVAAIAAVELPQGQWTDLIEILLGFVNTQGNANLRISTLQTIGIICDAIVRVFFFSPNYSIPVTEAAIETRDPESTMERNFNGCNSRCSKGGTFARSPTGCDSCLVGFAGVC
jgi:hypothetical protein